MNKDVGCTQMQLARRCLVVAKQVRGHRNQAEGHWSTGRHRRQKLEVNKLRSLRRGLTSLTLTQEGETQVLPHDNVELCVGGTMYVGR